ncbi:hypothetical protein IAT38_001953 [Cryptococcus sp. DSM 104549]
MTSPASSLPPHLNPPTSYPANVSPKSTRSRPSPTSSPQQGHSPRQSPRSGSTGMTDVDAVMRTSGGDASKALEGVVAERNTLQAQNTQLWKLIEKQRIQCAQLASDNDRLRQDRERANSRLVAAGLEPIGPAKKINASSSATGLGIKSEIPQIRRHNSDRDEVAGQPHGHAAKAREGEKGVQGGQGGQGASSSTLAAPPPSQLLPSPIPDRKTRRESSMVFPPEVRSFMTLADSPQDATHTIPPLATSGSQQQSTAGAGDVGPSNGGSSQMNGREREEGVMVPPPSSRVLSATMEAEDRGLTAPLKVNKANGAQAPSLAPVATQVPAPPPATRGYSTESVESAKSTKQLEQARSAGVKSPPTSVRSETMSPTESISETQSLSDTLWTASPSADELARPSTDSSVSLPSHDTATPRQSIDCQDSKLDKTPQAASSSSSSANSSSLPRLNPSLLPNTRLSIPTSTIFPNSSGRDVLCFIVSVTVRPPNAQPVSWNVAKLFSAFLDLDTRIKTTAGKSRKEWKQMVSALPEGKAWKDFAPSKIDQRKQALDAYLQSLLVAPISDKSDLCHFLSTDPVQAKQNDARKEGYLTKKGKNFGGWKTRYFVLDGPVMEYYESRGGSHLGSIVITNAQIGRQNRPVDSADGSDFRHAFLIIEASKKGSAQRHVLCAESDIERDKWIEILVRHVDPEPIALPPPQPAPTYAPPPAPAAGPAAGSKAGGEAAEKGLAGAQPQRISRKPSQLRKHSKDAVVVTASQPLSSLAANSKFSGAPSPSLFNSMETQRAAAQSPVLQTTSHPFPVPQVAGSPVSEYPPYGQERARTNSAAQQTGWASETTLAATAPNQSTDTLPSPPQIAAEPTPRANKRQSMMPGRPNYTPQYLSNLSNQGLSAPPGAGAGGSAGGEKDRDRKAKSRMFWGFGKTPEKISRPVFAVSLGDSIAVASVANLPAIVFRCIEYLEAKKAEEEEGIYRLSGSSAVIKGLKEKFDQEGDVNLLAVDEYWDPHAVAGLLKTYLRELPTSLLTRELHTRFLAVMDLVESSARIHELSRLVSELPPNNYALLRALTAHLILIVQNAASNKMTLRNIGIVFSPTLGIPAGIFSELVSNFGPIFDDEGEEEDTRRDKSGDAGSGAGENGAGGLRPGDADADETVKRKRNSLLYQAGGADAMLGLRGRLLDPTNEDSSSEMSADDFDGEFQSITSSDNVSIVPSTTTPRAEAYPSAAAVRKAKAAARGLEVQTNANLGATGAAGARLTGNSEASSRGSGRTPGLPVSPRPEMQGQGQGASPAIPEDKAAT